MFIFDVVGSIAHQCCADKLNTACYIYIHIDLNMYEVLCIVALKSLFTLLWIWNIHRTAILACFFFRFGILICSARNRREKSFFIIKYIWFNDIFLLRTYQIVYVSLNVLSNLTIINIFKTHRDVFICVHALWIG